MGFHGKYMHAGNLTLVNHIYRSAQIRLSALLIIFRTNLDNQANFSLHIDLNDLKFTQPSMLTVPPGEYAGHWALRRTDDRTRSKKRTINLRISLSENDDEPVTKAPSTGKTPHLSESKKYHLTRALIELETSSIAEDLLRSPTRSTVTSHKS